MKIGERAHDPLRVHYAPVVQHDQSVLVVQGSLWLPEALKVLALLPCLEPHPGLSTLGFPASHRTPSRPEVLLCPSILYERNSWR